MEATVAPWAKPTTHTAAAAPAAPAANTNTPSSSSSTTPIKLITTPQHLSAWKHSCAYADIVSFILSLNTAVRGIPSDAPHPKSQTVLLLCQSLSGGQSWIKDIPPIQQAMRFGNKAFRTWHQRMIQVTTTQRQAAAQAKHGVESQACMCVYVCVCVCDVQSLPSLLSSLLPTSLLSYVDELSAYLEESFGNPQRIDYGTEDFPALVFDVFTTYIHLMEELQSTYWLEPAGSKGAWGLDDYQFLCFLWGSSQLINHPDFAPSIILSPEQLKPYRHQHLFFHAILFITQMKTGPFAEHSPLLTSIAALPSWSKANAGLIKMYEAEVMEKFPIVQHIRFGTLLTMQPYQGGNKRDGGKQRPGIGALSATAAPSSSTTTSTEAEMPGRPAETLSHHPTHDVPPVPRFAEDADANQPPPS